MTEHDKAVTSEFLLNAIHDAFNYTPPQRGHMGSASPETYQPALSPSLDRLPAFVVHVNALDELLVTSLAQTLDAHLAAGSINPDAIMARCFTQLADKEVDSDFDSRKIKTEGDVTRLAYVITEQLRKFVKAIYKQDVEFEEHLRLLEKIPDRMILYCASACIVWQDKSWRTFEYTAPQIVELAKSAAGRQLQLNKKEEHGRAILYKIAVAMHDSGLHWGVLFGGDGVILFQRCVSKEEPTRYGLLCSDILGIGRMFVITLAMLLVPGSQPLIDVAKLKIPMPTAFLARDNLRLNGDNHRLLGHLVVDDDVAQAGEAKLETLKGISELDVCFTIPGYEITNIRVSSSHISVDASLNSPPHQGPKESQKIPDFSLPFPPSLIPTTPTLSVSESLCIGATGVVFAAHFGSLALVIKAILPGHPGQSDLRHEAHIYNVLASLQGRVLPRLIGLFEGEGWLMLVAEHCGDKVIDVNELSVPQREMLWQHACEIHAKGVRHADLEWRNFVVSASGAVRIVDYAFSDVGHKCEGTCEELSKFQQLLGLA